MSEAHGTGPPSARLWRLGAAEAARAIAAGELSSVALVAACLRRIDGRDELTRAWAHLDADAALAEAAARDAEPPRGPLHGVPVGVKDIVDTAGLPTERGSVIHAGRRPEADAACVARLRDAGAVILGKTVTTEFAYFSPGPTRNPTDPDRTPGGSSSGSAAAVGAGMVPVAIGSQTAGSVIRPAAYCGVLGLKPTRGAVDLTGVMPLSAALDTLGWFARRIEDLALLGSVLADDWPATPPAGDPAGAAGMRFAVARTPWWDRARADAQAALFTASERIADAGAAVREIDLPEHFAPLPDRQDALMAFDVARSLAHEYEHHAGDLSDVLRAFVERGRTTDRAEADAAVALGEECRALLAELLEPGEALLVPATTGEPPPFADGATGDPIFCRAWTLLGVPALAVPGLTGSSGAPIGVQLVAPARAEATVLAAGAWAVEHLA